MYEDMVDESLVCEGSNVRLIFNGKEEFYAEEISADVEQDEQTFKVLGSKNEYTRGGTEKGSFSLTKLKTDSSLLKLGFDKFEMIYEIGNASQAGYERVRLKNCKLKKLPLINAKGGELLKDEVEGSFSGWEPLDLLD